MALAAKNASKSSHGDVPEEIADAGSDALAIKKRSVVISGHRTSVSLENAFWYALKEIATRNGQTVNQLVSEIDDGRTGNLSSSIRVHVLLDADGGVRKPSDRGERH
jgi:predicted DNA-binding ribbon-helix-helix protein